MRRSRYTGCRKPLAAPGLATAINLVRLIDRLDDIPLAPTRVPAFEWLYEAS